MTEKQIWMTSHFEFQITILYLISYKSISYRLEMIEVGLYVYRVNQLFSNRCLKWGF